MFKLLLALLFCVNLNYVAQADTEERQLVQMSRQLLQANTTAASGTGDDDGTDDDGTDDDGADDDGDDDGTDDDGTDDDGTDDDGSGTDVDDGSDADGDDTDTDADDGDDADTDADDEDDDDDADADSADTDASGSDSNEDGDTNSSDTNSSDDDSDGDSDDSDDSDSDDSGDSDSDSSDADTNSDTNTGTGTNSGTNTFIDPCDGLEGTACTENYDADGNPNCAQNVNTADCYSIVQSQGLYGSGNFDEGYRAAQQSTQAETENLNTVVAVLGAFVAVLAVMVGGGAFWMYRRNQKQTQFRHESIAMETMHEAGGANSVALPMIEETA